MSAWGKTGRVTLHSGSTRGVYNDVHVDGEHVGNADHLPSGWLARAFDGGYGSADAPSRDAAVLWVLRRVDPALWRQERGAWLVRKRKPGEGIVWRGVQCSWNVMYPWVVVTPDGVTVDANASHQGALKTARARLRVEAVAR